MYIYIKNTKKKVKQKIYQNAYCNSNYCHNCILVGRESQEKRKRKDKGLRRSGNEGVCQWKWKGGGAVKML